MAGTNDFLDGKGSMDSELRQSRLVTKPQYSVPTEGKAFVQRLKVRDSFVPERQLMTR